MPAIRTKLLVPCAFACAADVTMTLVGQPAAYWAGDRQAAEDFNPVARALLELHPAAFPVAGAAGLFLLWAILRVVPFGWIALLVAFVVTFAQTVAAAGWMARFGLPGWAGAVVLLVVAERAWAWATRPARAPVPA